MLKGLFTRHLVVGNCCTIHTSAQVSYLGLHSEMILINLSQRELTETAP